MTPEDLADLQRAKTLLQKPGLAARMTGLLSIPIAKGLALIPARWSRLVGRATHGAIEKALSAAVVTLRSDRPRRAANHLHLFLVMTHHEEREDHEGRITPFDRPSSCPSWLKLHCLRFRHDRIPQGVRAHQGPNRAARR